MSALFNKHTSVVYDVKTAKPFEGQRGVTTKAKGVRNVKGEMEYGEHLQQSMFTSIPLLTLGDIDFTQSRVQQQILELFYKAQNEILLERNKAGIRTHVDADLDCAAILTYMESTEPSNAWDFERYMSYLTQTVMPHIIERMVAKSTTLDVAESKVLAVLKAHAEKLGTKAKLPMQYAVQMVQFLEYLGTELETDSVAMKIYERCDKVINPVNTLIDSLDLGL